MSSTCRVEFVSDRFCEILGVTRQQFENEPGIVPDIVHLDEQAEFARLNAVAIASMTTACWEGRVIVGGEMTIRIRF